MRNVNAGCRPPKAAAMPNSEFVTLPGANHILIEGSEAFDLFLHRFEQFAATLDL